MPFRMQSTAMPQLTGAYASAVPNLLNLGIAQESNEKERVRAAIREFGANQARKRAIRQAGGGSERGTYTGAATGAASGAASGAAIGSVVPVIGTLIGAAVGAIVGGVGGGVLGHQQPQGGGPVDGGGGGMGQMLTDLTPLMRGGLAAFQAPKGQRLDAFQGGYLGQTSEDWDYFKPPGGGAYQRSMGGPGRAYPFPGSLGMGMP